jgi:restriction system protein
MAELPQHHEFFKPTLEALIDLGGLASIQEIEHRLTHRLGLGLGLTPHPHSQPQPHPALAPHRAEAARDRMAWARSRLKQGRFLDNPRRGAWVLTEAGRGAADWPAAELRRQVAQAHGDARALRRAGAASRPDGAPADGPGFQAAASPADRPAWVDQLLQQIQAIEPAGFERLCQTLLRDCGFTRVEVTGQSADGGVDGSGVLRLNLVSFHVRFQCKRWKGAVGAEIVRNFRGALQGRADKGIILTTGTFTPQARHEAIRDGAPAIDLIDGEALCHLLKERGLGVSVREVRVEEVSVDAGFFAGI